MTTSPSRLLFASLGGLAVAGGAVSGVVVLHDHRAGRVAPSVQVAAAPPTSAPLSTDRSAAGGSPADQATAPSGSLFRDGDYAAPGHYLTPGGNESILVQLRVRDGFITAASATTQALSPTARQFQEQFRAAVAARVVSRPLAALSVPVIAGASLTTRGFDDALAAIRLQAER